MNIEGAEKIYKTLRVLVKDKPGYLGRLCTVIGEHGANIGEIARIKVGVQFNTRDVSLTVGSEDHLREIMEAVGKLEGIIIEEVIDPVLELHKGGKIRSTSRVRLESLAQMRRIYTPGVANVCRAIQADPELAHEYTSIDHSVAIVTDGSAILGLGNIGPVAGMPVMEGKAVLFDKLVGLSGIPILLGTQDVDAIVETVVNIAPTFGAIKLEDIAAPRCFEVERRLMERLDRPVMHDDQHGTATVVLAALLNATTYVGVSLKNQTVGIIGLGAAGMGIGNLLLAHGVKHLIGTDLKDEAKSMLAERGGHPTTLPELMAQADIVIATTGVPGLVKEEMVRPGQIILALSNPNPEIRPDAARAAGAAFAADGRSVNNALAFPGIFKGALQARATRINDRMKIAAARAIAAAAEKGELVPQILDPQVHLAVTAAVERAALESGVARSQGD
ncbi:MAG: NAD-dependent malic enzyme [Acidobacteria bacterium]|nr:NAD-dependent malic enzyme [Acidobacteriota bacterium]